MRVKLTSITALFATALWMGAGSARAQDALGAGNVLDSNLGVNSGGLNAPVQQPDFASRNAIVTGNVAGGRGFRGAVGYGAASDFRAPIGSNDLFRFRADSAYSSSELLSLGATYEQLRFGQEMSFYRYDRAGTGATPRDVSPSGGVIEPEPIGISMFDQEFTPARVKLDRVSLASSQPYLLETAAEPRTVGIMPGGQDQPLVYASSSLRGLTLQYLNQYVGSAGLTTFDAARVHQDASSGLPIVKLGEPYRTRFDHAVGDARRPDMQADRGGIDGPVDESVDGSTQPDYDRILQRLVDRYARRGDVDATISPEILSRLDTQYESLRSRLTGRPSPQGVGQAAGGAQGSQRQYGDGTDPQADPRGGGPIPPSAQDAVARADGRQPSNPDVTGGIRQTPHGVTDQSTTDAAVPDPTARIDSPSQPLPTGAARPPRRIDEERDSRDPRDPMLADDQIGLILKHGERIDKLAGDSEDRFNELLASAEQKLREGDYFVAERRFDRALRFTPGHPMASVGAAHAQLGAGLYLSASLSLRHLLSNQPELIDMTYSADLLPAKDRLDAAIDTLKERLARDAVDRGGYGFLLAYIGKQTSDRALIEQGLGSMARSEPGSKLLPLLQEVWLTERQADEKEEPAEPAPTEQPAEPEK